MESLLEVRWEDPVAGAGSRVLRSVPRRTEETTGDLPHGEGKAFAVYRADSPDDLETPAHAISSLGTQVRVTRVVDAGTARGRE